MRGKLVLTVALLILSLILIPDAALGDVSVGVKAGDWIEYNVTTTGNPPEEHNVTWAKLEVMRVQGPEIDVNVTTMARNGSVSSLLMTLNIEKGEIGAWWIIPTNLSPGATFYDAFLNQTVAINGEEQLQYAGATRTITNATVPTRVKQWDKATGVFVLSRDILPDYTINVVAFSTNLWSPQILGMDSTVFYVIVLIVILVIAALALVLVWSRRKKQNGPQK